MKRKLGREALAKEAAYWKLMKAAGRDNPGKVCHK